MKKKLLLLFSLSFLLLGVGACGEDNPTPDDPNNSIVNAISIEADETEIHLTGFEEYQVEYEVTPSNATTEVTFTSSNTDIATVTSSASNTVKITPVAEGSCVVKAESENGKTAEITVNVVGA